MSFIWTAGWVTGTNDRYFLVMEYVEGETLRKKIERGERPDSDAFRRVVLG